jgi:hypothetical protein
LLPRGYEHYVDDNSDNSSDQDDSDNSSDHDNSDSSNDHDDGDNSSDQDNSNSSDDHDNSDIFDDQNYYQNVKNIMDKCDKKYFIDLDPKVHCTFSGFTDDFYNVGQ